MKNFYLFIALLLVSGSVNAKGESSAMVTAGPVVNGKFPHFSNQVNVGSNGNPAPSNAILRLVSKTYAKHNGTSFIPVDSISYKYDGNRGGVLQNDDIDNDESLMYSESTHLTYDIGSGTYQNSLRRIQEYYPDNMVKFLTYQKWDHVANAFEDSYRYAYSYSNGKMISSTHEYKLNGAWINPVTSAIIYNGQAVSAMESPDYRVAFQYDNNAKLVSVVDEKYTGSGWQFKEKHTYEYIGNDVAKHIYFEWDAASNTWKNKRFWQYTYSGTDVTSETEVEWNGSAWVNVSQHVYTYDAKHNMTTDVKKIWNASMNGFVESNREDWTYNSQDLPEAIIMSTWNGSGWASSLNDGQYHFYYEPNFPATVNTVNSNTGIHLYPVPAIDIVNVTVKWEVPQNFTVSVYDVKGSPVTVYSESATKEYSKTIPISHLPSGTYFISVNSTDYHTTRRFVISR